MDKEVRVWEKGAREEVRIGVRNGVNKEVRVWKKAAREEVRKERSEQESESVGKGSEDGREWGRKGVNKEARTWVKDCGGK